MQDADAIEIQALKADSFGRIALMRDAAGPFVRRDLRHVPLWLRLPAWWLARREAQALRVVGGGGAVLGPEGREEVEAELHLPIILRLESAHNL